MGMMFLSLWVAIDVQASHSLNSIVFTDNLDLLTLGEHT